MANLYIHGNSEPITYAQAQKLEFFQACLKEGMRLQPAVVCLLSYIFYMYPDYRIGNAYASSRSERWSSTLRSFLPSWIHSRRIAQIGPQNLHSLWR